MTFVVIATEASEQPNLSQQKANPSDGSATTIRSRNLFENLPSEVSEPKSITQVSFRFNINRKRAASFIGMIYFALFAFVLMTVFTARRAPSISSSISSLVNWHTSELQIDKFKFGFI